MVFLLPCPFQGLQYNPITDPELLYPEFVNDGPDFVN